MEEKHFTHLHLHTDYSLLDGAITIEKLINYGKKYSCKALAISDHGNIFAAVKFFQKCKKAGIKPILGMEAYISDNRKIKNINEKYYHLLLLVQNETGYKNLCKLISHSYIDGFYFKPRIDYSLLQEYNQGLIATSTCLGGHIPQLILQQRDEEALKMIKTMQNLFEERYYLEVQPGIIEEQKLLNTRLFQISEHLHIPIFASGDCHYPTAEDRYAHEVMLAVQTRTTMDDPNRMTFGDCRAHMQTPDEMLEAFPERHDVVWQTGKIADKCTFEFKTGKLFFPQFPLPKNEICPEKYFRKQCEAGFQKLIDKKRIPEDKITIYKDRLEFEIQMIIKSGFPTYLLVVCDFTQWAKRNNIAVGPGRGSVVGSLVAWALEITDLDPIKYNLLFERFLNPERVSMPDIDMDFCIEGRERVIQYVKDMYGHDKVGQIITFGTMMAKGVLKDVARALGFSFEDANAITDLIPDELKITLKEALEQEPRLKKMCEQNSRVAELFDIAMRLEGTTRHASKHAAGIVISPEPIADVLPIYVPPRTTDIVTQYAMTELEELGFLKIDFLGLKNLTLITRVINSIKKNHGIDLDIQMIPLDSQKAYQLLCAGQAAGVFQFESEGVRDVLRRLQPECFEDLIAVNALYRPGPLGSGMVDDFIERKRGRQEIKYLFPELEPILRETCGVIVYQEQVMKIASVIGGYSLGEADILRRAMGKKKAEVMAEQKAIFVSRAKERNFDEKKVDELFELMAYFAGYGFNKSHSAAYALIAYQTAYLKSHYPHEFMAALVSLEAGNPDAFVQYIHEIKMMKIPLLPPDIHHSEKDFIPEKNGIRFGLKGIKNVGDAALDSILASRKQKGDFKDLLDLCTRIDLRTCNKRVLEHLIVSGTLDCLSRSRADKCANLDQIIEHAQRVQDNNKTGQLSLFGITTESPGGEPVEINWITSQEWKTSHILEREKEVLGVYISKHPLDEYNHLRHMLSIKSLDRAMSQKSKKFSTMATLISLKEITTKKGDLMAFAIFEDYNSQAEVILFPKIYKNIYEIIKKESLFLITGDISESTGQQLKIKAEELIPLSAFTFEQIKQINISLPEKIEISVLNELKQLIEEGKTKLAITFAENNHSFTHKPFKGVLFTEKLSEWLSKKSINVSYDL